VAHRRPDTKVYWHLDENYVGTTETFHQFAFAPAPGKHVLTLVDEQGNRLEQRFEIVLKK
jgi:penicillin-binding protein 1C